MLKVNRRATARVRPAESALRMAATKRFMAAIPADALQPAGAPVVSPRTFQLWGSCAARGE
jgi:hypothetical protein